MFKRTVSGKFFFLIVTFFGLLQTIQAQHDTSAITTDTAVLQNVKVEAFSSGFTWKDVPASVAVINQQQFSRYDAVSMVPVLNTVTGVRMEERSPGSYRLSIRGSLLRSPFGVRNVKIYLDEVPLTDATGNTYLNLIDINELKSAEIIKGPSSSFYGANTGGALLLKTDNVSGISAGLSGGSYGLLRESLSYKKNTNHFFFGLQQSHTQSDGYRQQSALRRDVIQFNSKWNISHATCVSFLAFYSNLHYETPGGITLQQMDSFPKLARQPTSTFPGAVEQNAGVYNKTYFAASTFKVAFAKHFNNITSFVIDHTDFQNPFITNFEKRKEWNYSGRTDFQFSVIKKHFSLKGDAGGELQYNTSYIRVYDNDGGTPGNNQYKDNIHTSQYFLFAQVNLGIGSRLNIQLGVSDNKTHFNYTRTTDSIGIYPIVKNAGATLSPRIAVSYSLSKNISWYTVAAKGFSPPTLAEVLPSTGNFDAQLQPEEGWNYETGFKGSLLHDRISYNTSFYYFTLKHAIVRRTDSNGADYFVNAGGTIQKGFELWVNALIIDNDNKFLQRVNVWNSFSYQPYRFDSYILGSADYSGNKITGVPRTINVLGIDITTRKKYTLNITLNYTSSLPLNDANTVFADHYFLVQCKLGKEFLLHKTRVNLFAGADNLLDELYSLGNDINALGSRYYNPAPGRNFYAGIKCSW